jgi:tetratricopeptide (TPR) repeat protein
VNPNSFVGNLNLGVEYINNGDYSRGTDACTRAAELAAGATSPVEEEMARDSLSDAFHRAGRLDDAILEQRGALAITSGHPELRWRWERHTAEIGELLCEAGRYPEALTYLQTAHAFAPLDQKVAALLQRATTTHPIN